MKKQHRWGGAGYRCVDCGAIKDTVMEGEECSGDGEVGFDVWLYHAGAGWWRDDDDAMSAADAAEILKAKIGVGNVVAGAILPAGQRFGLFSKRMEVPK